MVARPAKTVGGAKQKRTWKQVLETSSSVGCASEEVSSSRTIQILSEYLQPGEVAVRRLFHLPRQGSEYPQAPSFILPELTDSKRRKAPLSRRG